MEQEYASSGVFYGHNCNFPPRFPLGHALPNVATGSNSVDDLPSPRLLHPSRRRHNHQHMACMENLAERFRQQNLDWPYDESRDALYLPHFSLDSPSSSSSAEKDDSDDIDIATHDSISSSFFFDFGPGRARCSQLRDTIAEVAGIHLSPPATARIPRTFRDDDTMSDLQSSVRNAMRTLEVDERYAEMDDSDAVACSSQADLTGALERQSLNLPFNTSAEAALRCRKIVRNVTRLRRRKTKKREHRNLKAAAAATAQGDQSTQMARPGPSLS